MGPLGTLGSRHGRLPLPCHLRQLEEKYCVHSHFNVPEIVPSIVFAVLGFHAPALEAAKLGVAMDIMGAQVAMQAADRFLTDDYFASIVEASTKAVHFRTT